MNLPFAEKKYIVFNAGFFENTLFSMQLFEKYIVYDVVFCFCLCYAFTVVSH